jgi:heme A synthase
LRESIASWTPATAAEVSHLPYTIGRVLVHDRYGFVLTVVAAVGACATIVSLFRPRMLPVLRLYLRVTIALVAVQVAIGLVLVATGQRPHQLLHWLYGATMLLTLPVAMSIGKRLGAREQQIWLAGGAVLTVLFALRAMATG